MTAVAGRILDVPALIDAATGRTEYMRALLVVTTRLGHTLGVPSTVRASAADRLNSVTQLAELDVFCEAGGSVLEIPLAPKDAADIEQLARDHFHGEIAAAHAAHAAGQRDWAVITNDNRAPMFEAAGIETQLLP